MISEPTKRYDYDAVAPQPRAGRSPTLPCGLTEKMHRFAECVADGFSLADAYRMAFHTANMKDKTVRDEASRLAKNPGVIAAVEAIRAEREAENIMRWRSKEELIWDLLWQLIEEQSTSPRTKVQALALAAHMAGIVQPK